MARKVKGEFSACGHRISYWYDLGTTKRTDELESALAQHAEERSRESIAQDYVSGELNFYDPRTDVEVRGWWDIERE